MSGAVSTAGVTAEVTVRGIAAGGSGVADLPDGRVVFVPRTAPGDRARIRLVKERPRWAEATLERLLESAPERVSPPCGLFARCGGCQLQHLPYDAQLEWKRRIVADALERIGGLSGTPPIAIVPSPRALEYRSRVSFTLRRLRGGRVVAGFHALGRPAHVVDVERCLLADPAVAAAWKALRAGWGLGARALPAAGRLRLTLREAAAGVELLVEGGPPGWDASPLAAAVPQLTAVWHRPYGRASGPEEGSGSGATAGSGTTAEPELRAGTRAAGGGVAFEQVNREAAALLRAHVLDRIDVHAGRRRADAAPSDGSTEGPDPVAGRAVDAYCGQGAYGRALAGRGWSVTGIELDPVAAAAASADAPTHWTVRVGSVEALLPGALPAQLVVLNPPRGGLAPAVTEQLAERPPETVVYVSCDPATLARDLGRLAPMLTLSEVTAFDLFPQTSHVETVAVLR